MVEHFFTLYLRQLFRIARTTHERRSIVAGNYVSRKHSGTDHQWAGPCTFSHFIYSDNKRRALAQ